MSDLRKKRIKTVLKYTWPFYIISTFLITLGLYFIFGVTHRTPAYKTLTLFVSGQAKDTNQLRDDMLEKYKDNELVSFSCILADPSDSNYNSKLTIPGYNSADVLIIHEALELSNDLISSRYAGFTLYSQEGINYGVKLNKAKAEQYFYFPSDDCYMFLNGNSENTGEYSKTGIKEHDTALRVLQDWGM